MRSRRLRGGALALLLALGANGCSDDPAADTPAPTASAEVRQVAQEFLDSLVSKKPCDDVWALVISDGEPRSEFCGELAEYRTEVSALTLGEVTDAAEDYTIFRVRVDYLDGSPSVMDSEIEVDHVDGVTKVFAGLP